MPSLRRAQSSPLVRSQRSSPYNLRSRPSRTGSRSEDSENGPSRRVSQSTTRRVLADLDVGLFVGSSQRSASTASPTNEAGAEVLGADGIPLREAAEPLDLSPEVPDDMPTAQMESLSLSLTPQTPVRRRRGTTSGFSSTESTPESTVSHPSPFDTINNVNFTQPNFLPPPTTTTPTRASRRSLGRASTAPSFMFSGDTESRFGDFAF